MIIQNIFFWVLAVAMVLAAIGVVRSPNIVHSALYLVVVMAGAWDVYRIPVQMKKGRTGVQLTVLCSPHHVSALRDLLFRETTTIGMHWRLENKISLKRDFVDVQTPWGPVKIKIARWPSGEVANAAPEYEDCRKLATEHAVPLKQVMQEAARLHAITADISGEKR